MRVLNFNLPLYFIFHEVAFMLPVFHIELGGVLSHQESASVICCIKWHRFCFGYLDTSFGCLFG